MNATPCTTARQERPRATTRQFRFRPINGAIRKRRGDEKAKRSQWRSPLAPDNHNHDWAILLQQD